MVLYILLTPSQAHINVSLVLSCICAPCIYSAQRRFHFAHVSTCIVNVNNVPFTLNTPFMILHLQIFRIMEGVRVSSYVSMNSEKLRGLLRFDCVRVCMHVCLSSSFCFFSSSSIALRGGKCICSSESEKTRVWKRKDNAHTQRAGRRGRMNPHRSPMQLC